MNIKTVTAVAALVILAACGTPTESTDDKPSDATPADLTGELGDTITIDSEATITVTDVDLNADNGDKVPDKGAWASITVTIESHKKNLFATPKDFDIVDSDNTSTPGETINRHPDSLPLDGNGMPKGTKREGVIIFDIDPDRYDSKHGSITYSSTRNEVMTWTF